MRPRLLATPDGPAAPTGRVQRLRRGTSTGNPIPHHREEVDAMSKDDDEWTGSMKKPWLNPPQNHELGVKKGLWGPSMIGIGLVVVAVIVVLVLVKTGHLDRGWAYAVLPVAIIAAAASRVLTIFKAGAEDKQTR
jgi:hypothetical protein